MKQSAKPLSIGFLFDDTLDNDAGVAQYVKTVGSWLASHGHKVSYIVGESHNQRPEGRVYSAAKNVGVRWAGNRLSMPIWPKRQLIKSVLHDNHFDILHVMAPYSPFMSATTINNASTDCAIIASFHVFPAGPLSRAGGRQLKNLYGKSFRRIDKFLSVSSAAAQYAKETFGVDSQISPNVIDVKRFKNKGSVKTGRIVFLGRLVPRKGCAELIKAFAGLFPKHFKNLELVIAGNGPQRPKLEKLVNNLDLNNHIKFLGYIDENDKAPLLASAQIACFPSLGAESFGIVLIEAMAAGAGIVLGGNNPGYQTVLGDQPQLLIDPKNTNEFTARLETLLSDNQNIKQLNMWQQKAVQQYDIEIVGPRLVEIYRQTIAKRQAKL